MNALLDSSFLIDLLNELAARNPGPACVWLRRNPRVRLWVSAVSVAEVLEGAEDVEFVSRFFARFGWQGLHHAHASRVALLQRRSEHRMGENDAWQVAVVMKMRGRIVAHDPRAFSRLGRAYEDHREAAR